MSKIQRRFISHFRSFSDFSSYPLSLNRTRSSWKIAPVKRCESPALKKSATIPMVPDAQWTLNPQCSHCIRIEDRVQAGVEKRAFSSHYLRPSTFLRNSASRSRGWPGRALDGAFSGAQYLYESCIALKRQPIQCNLKPACKKFTWHTCNHRHQLYMSKYFLKRKLAFSHLFFSHISSFHVFHSLNEYKLF